jgi:hypothetical protein
MISKTTTSETTTSLKAFYTILECTNYAQTNKVAKEWCNAMDYIADKIGIKLDKEKHMWVTNDDT